MPRPPENEPTSAVDDEEDISDQDSASEAESGEGSETSNEDQGPVVNPLSAEELAKFQAAQERAGIIYLSRIPPGMRPTKVRHLMSAYGEIGRVYLQQEDAKRAYLRRKHTSTKKAHYTEGWIEFIDKKIARRVAEMLNAQPIGGKKGTRWRDDVWTMKYLPRFKWNMLTEQIAHEAAVHREHLRVELSQSKAEQRDYLRNVELARVLKKREEKKKAKAGDVSEEATKSTPLPRKRKEVSDDRVEGRQKRPKTISSDKLDTVLSSIF